MKLNLSTWCLLGFFLTLVLFGMLSNQSLGKLYFEYRIAGKIVYYYLVLAPIIIMLMSFIEIQKGKRRLQAISILILSLFFIVVIQLLTGHR